MGRIIHLVAWLPLVALVVCTVGVVAASETMPDVPRVDGASGAEQSPRYLRHDEQIARPLPAETRQSAPPFAETLVPRLRATERLTSGESGEAQGLSRPTGAANREIPLSRRTSQEPDSQRGSEMPPLATGAASLGIVLGLFLVVVWAVRRGLPKGAGMLPSDVIEVLGRAPLVGKQNVHLIRCGSKLLLVCIAPGSVQTLTEITDLDEVERLTGLCQTKRGPTASFRAALAHFGGKQPVPYFSEHQVEEMNFGAFESDVAGSRVRAQ